MTEIVRDRDVIVLVKGKSVPVVIDSVLSTAGWAGGQGVAWTDIPAIDQFIVTFSDGTFGGFLLWGSNESADQLISYVENQPTYKFATMGMGAWVISTRTFEQYTYASRTGGGPLVPITYRTGEGLRFSLRGLLTNEDEWTLSLDPRRPNKFLVGVVVKIPSALTHNYMTVQTGF